MLLGRQEFGGGTSIANWNPAWGTPPGAVTRAMRAIEFLSMADTAARAHELLGVLADEARQVPSFGEDFRGAMCDALIRWALGRWLPEPRGAGSG